jgi:hypothetical protein
MLEAIRRRLPPWTPLAALSLSLMFAWANFLFTGRWAALPGALRGWKAPWYAAALGTTTILVALRRRTIGQSASPGRFAAALLVCAGVVVLVAGFFSRLPLSSWSQIPFVDDWTPLFQEAVNGVQMLRHGVVVGWNWSFLGGYPTSTEIAQSFALLAFLPMQLLGDRIGYHLIHAIFFFTLPAIVWWDLSQEDRRLGLIAGGFACLFVAGLYATLGTSGDTNSLAGVFSATVALLGSRAAGLGRRWGGPVLLIGLTCALYSHVGFFVYALIYLAFEAVYYADRRAGLRLIGAAAFAACAALPLQWEGFRYRAFFIVNNAVYDPTAPIHWAGVLRSIYYSVEILALPQRWFNDYRSLVNVWWPAMLAAAVVTGRSRAGFYAWSAVITLALLRLNTAEFGVAFDRIMHMLPVLAAPALAAVVLRMSGTRAIAIGLTATIALYVQSDFRPLRHVSSIRDFDPALIDHLAQLDGNLVLIEVSPHHDMDSDPVRKSPKTPFDAHFEGLLPSVRGQRFYGQMWDGWAWNIFRGQLVAAGTFAGRAIADTPTPQFEREMRRWGVKHLLVWTDATKEYLSRGGAFTERWHAGRWSEFELAGADVREVVTVSGTGELRHLSFRGGDVVLDGVTAGEPVIVRTNYYPAWTAYDGPRAVPLLAHDGQLAFTAPASGSYVVHLEYPARRWLTAFAILMFLWGVVALARVPNAPVTRRV